MTTQIDRAIALEESLTGKLIRVVLIMALRVALNLAHVGGLRNCSPSLLGCR